MTALSPAELDDPHCPPRLSAPFALAAACQRELFLPDAPRLTSWMRALGRLAVDWGPPLVRQVPFAADAYTRTRIFAGDSAELWLLGWLPGQGSSVHDHAGVDTAYVVLAGTLEEEIFVADDCDRAHLAEARRVTVGGVVATDGFAIHRVRVVGADPLVTLHLFAPRYIAGRDFELGEAL